MSAEGLVVQQLMDRLQHGTVASQPDLLAPDLVIHLAEGPVRGREAALLLMGTTHDAFRDVQLQHEIVSEAPGVVVVAFEARGVQQRELFGFRPKGNQASLKGVAVCRFSGAAISQLQVFSDMANLIRPGSSVGETESGSGKETEDQAAASADSISVRDIWLAGLGAVAAAEEHGTRLARSLIERGETWEPVVRTSTARAGETIGRAASTATAAAREIGDKLKSAASTGEATVVQFVKSLTEQSPTRKEFDELKRRMDALVARVESEESTASTSRSQLAHKD